MNSELLYRKALKTDVELLRDLALLSYGQYLPQLDVQYQEELKANMGRLQTWEDMLVVAQGFVCTIGNAIVGMGFLIPSGNPWDIFKYEWAYIRAVGIHPDFEGRGIATTITKMCIEHAVSLTEKTIALHTSEIMPAARHIYEKMGFKQQYEIPPRLGKRYWIYTLDVEALIADKKLQET